MRITLEGITRGFTQLGERLTSCFGTRAVAPIVEARESVIARESLPSMAAPSNVPSTLQVRHTQVLPQQVSTRPALTITILGRLPSHVKDQLAAIPGLTEQIEGLLDRGDYEKCANTIHDNPSLSNDVKSHVLFCCAYHLAENEDYRKAAILGLDIPDLSLRNQIITIVTDKLTEISESGDPFTKAATNELLYYIEKKSALIKKNAWEDTNEEEPSPVHSCNIDDEMDEAEESTFAHPFYITDESTPIENEDQKITPLLDIRTIESVFSQEDLRQIQQLFAERRYDEAKTIIRNNPALSTADQDTMFVGFTYLYS
ncbi:MAG: hypothetical protein HY860_05050 [Chlamydiales bacterium]|nr:hypothetical protein [Chlamydiales bacterium]